MGKLYYLGNARSHDQHDEMVRLEAEGICLFCPEHLLTSGKKILLNTPNWIVTTNDYPYPGTKTHLLLVPKAHVHFIDEVSEESFMGLHEIMGILRKCYGPEHSGWGGRNGLPEYTGGTIRHLHLHYTVGDPESDVPVRLKLSSKPK